MTIEEWVKETHDLIVEKYNSMGLRSSGNFERELEEIIEERKDGISITFMGAMHSLNLEKGRESGRFPPPDAIMKWIDEKPINFNESEISKKSLAFLIGRKIAREGIAVPNERNDGRIFESISNERVKELASITGMGIVNNFEKWLFSRYK